MADLTANAGQFVKIKDGQMPTGAVEIRIQVEEFNGTPITTLTSAVGQFAVADMLPAKPPATYRFKGQARDSAGNWGAYSGIPTTLELVAPDPPETIDWEVVNA